MTKFYEKYMSEWKDIGTAAFVTWYFNWDDERKNSTKKNEDLLLMVNGRDGNSNSKLVNVRMVRLLVEAVV